MAGETIEISCDECALQASEACSDCVVSFLLDEAGGALVIDVAEARAVRLLHEAGLVPALRHARRAG
jgi:hypothetical protein